MAGWWRRAREPAQATAAWAGFAGAFLAVGWLAGSLVSAPDACAVPSRDSGTGAPAVAAPQVFRTAAAGPRHPPAAKASAEGPAAAALRGIIQMPVPGASLSSAFTARRYHPLLHVVRPHWGSDYDAPLGTPVRAAADGIVAAVVRSPTYGLAVDVSHWGGRLVTRYAHLSAVTVRPGEAVRQGAVIGRVGATGLATGPHLHFEVFAGGLRRDPALLLGAAGDRRPR